VGEDIPDVDLGSVWLGKSMQGHKGWSAGKYRIGNGVLVRIADDPSHTRKSGDFRGGALGVATSDEDSGAGVMGVNAADSGAGGAIGVGGYGAGVEDDELGRVGGSRFEIASDELTRNGRTIGLRRTTAEIFDVKTGHRASMVAETGVAETGEGWVHERSARGLNRHPLLEALSAEYRPTLGRAKGYGGLFVACRADGTGFHFVIDGSGGLGVAAKQGCPFGFAELATFGLVLELLVVEK
jgi:hypothetical protein